MQAETSPHSANLFRLLVENVRDFAIFMTEDRERRVPEQEMETALAEGHAEDRRWHLRKDGSRFWADGLLMLLSDGGGVPRGFAKILRDDTEAKLTEERL